MKNKRLEKKRKKIDLLDRQLLKLITKRTRIVDQMMKVKKNKNEIIDRKRINEILKKIKKNSIKNNIDPRIGFKIWKAMIWAYVDYQKRNFKKC